MLGPIAIIGPSKMAKLLTTTRLGRAEAGGVDLYIGPG